MRLKAVFLYNCMKNAFSFTKFLLLLKLVIYYSYANMLLNLIVFPWHKKLVKIYKSSLDISKELGHTLLKNKSGKISTLTYYFVKNILAYLYI